MRSIPTLALFLADAFLAAMLIVATSAVAQEPVAPAATGAPVVLPPSRLSAAESQTLVAFHDAARKEVGVGPVRWSPEVAAFAQQWADHIAATGKFEHRPYDVATSETAPLEPQAAKQIYGENLAIGNSPDYGPADGAQGWYAEKKDYVAGMPIPTDFAEFKAGHYTQLVWSKTTKIGAGKAVVQVGEFKGWTVIVCNYDPPGNYEGRAPFAESQK
ncbi:MAG: hypothetical protein K8U03_21120 [Planctomycetia bacterium]|nr:hypothetical protein [Planctomycetia bacterium]